jgi:hypothetical protein
VEEKTMMKISLVWPRVVLYAMVICVSGGSSGADITLPFGETWNQETSGDNANQLTRWNYESSYGTAPASDTTIVTVSGAEKALNMNPRNSESTGIRSQRADFSGSVLSIKSEIQLTTDGAGAGVIGFCKATGPLFGYVLAVARDPGGGAWLDLRKFFGNLNDSFTTGAVYFPFDPLTRHTYRLDAAFTGGQIDFSVYVDGEHMSHPYLDVTDSNPHTFAGGLNFVLASNYGQQAYFDNFAATPEPATLLLLAAGAIALRKCHR